MWDATYAAYIVLLEQLHADQCEDEACGNQEHQWVPQSSQWRPHDFQEEAKMWPPLGQSEDTQLQERWQDKQSEKKQRLSVPRNQLIVGIFPFLAMLHRPERRPLTGTNLECQPGTARVDLPQQWRSQMDSSSPVTAATEWQDVVNMETAGSSALCSPSGL